MRIDAKLDGVNKAIAKIQSYETSKREAVSRIVATTAKRVEAQAQALAPVDTGRLRDSIHTDIDTGGLGATVGTAVNYAVYQEFGTRYMDAQPFLFPSWEMYKKPFVNDIKKALKL